MLRKTQPKGGMAVRINTPSLASSQATNSFANFVADLTCDEASARIPEALVAEGAVHGQCGAETGRSAALNRIRGNERQTLAIARLTSPAHDGSVRAHAAAVVAARRHVDERARRGVRGSRKIVAPAIHRAVLSQTAGGREA